MKPSARILQLALNCPQKTRDGQFLEAIVIYLDEEWEKTQKEIQDLKDKLKPL